MSFNHQTAELLVCQFAELALIELRKKVKKQKTYESEGINRRYHVHDHELLEPSHAVLGPLLQAVVQIRGLELAHELLPVDVAVPVGIDSLHDQVYLS